jgi:hypothetical protein
MTECRIQKQELVRDSSIGPTWKPMTVMEVMAAKAVGLTSGSTSSEMFANK